MSTGGVDRFHPESRSMQQSNHVAKQLIHIADLTIKNKPNHECNVHSDTASCLARRAHAFTRVVAQNATR